MLRYFLEILSGRGTNVAGLLIYLFLSSPAIVSTLLYLRDRSRKKAVRWISEVYGAFSSFSVTFFFYPISVSEETDFLTLSFLLFAANIVMLGGHSLFSRLNGKLTVSTGWTLSHMLLFCFGIILGAFLRHTG